MKLKYIVLMVIMVTCSSFAQELLTNITWNIGIPVSKMSDYVTEETYRGFSFSGRRFLNKENSVGIILGWNVFDEKNYDPINIDAGNGSGTISGTQVRSVNSFPILVGIHHHYGSKKDMRAFIGLNAGTYYILQRLNVGAYVIDNDNWHFGLAPEAGVIIPVGDENTMIYLGGRYNYAFDSGDAFGGSENNFYSFYELNIGFSFSSRWF